MIRYFELILIMSIICFPLYFGTAFFLIRFNILPREWGEDNLFPGDQNREDVFGLLLKSAVGFSAATIIVLAAALPNLGIQSDLRYGSLIAAVSAAIGLSIARKGLRKKEHS